MSAKRTTRRAGIDERAFPYDVHGTEKPYYRTRAGLSAKHRGTQEQYLATQLPPSRRKEAFHAYTFKRKPASERPQSAPVYGTDLGGSQSLGRGRGSNNGRQQREQKQEQDPPRPKMRPNSAHFLHTASSSSRPHSAVDLDKFPAPRPARSEAGSRQQVFMHPTPPTDDLRILTHHEHMFYTHHFAKLKVKKSESEKYKLDESFNRDSHHYDHKTTTLHAPSNEAITDYRLGRRQQAFPPRVMRHQKSGRQLSGVAVQQNHGIASNALGGFYS